jgi:hypothetical protein
MPRKKKDEPAKKPGRKSKYPAEAKKIIDKIKTYGFSRAKACLAAGIHIVTLERWEKEYPDFAECLMRAEIECEEYHLGRIRNSVQGRDNPDWKSSAWFLARKYPDQYGEKIKQDISLLTEKPLEEMTDDEILERKKLLRTILGART